MNTLTNLKMYKFFAFLLLFTNLTYSQDCNTEASNNQKTNQRDLRGLFLTTVFNLDWPSSRTLTIEKQKEELINILNTLDTNNYNTVFFQVRTEADAFYKSTYEPWSRWITNIQGKDPGWDPLAFAIEEAHKRSLELHAWLNPYRAKVNATAYAYSADHILSQNPSWGFAASNNANLWILNPGLPEVRNHITKIVEDVALNYNVDGIHFDDYFYPSGGMATNQDSQTYINQNPKNIANINDWRRDNVNQMVSMVYSKIQEVNLNKKKNIVFGISPFGIWKSGTPAGIVGTSSYDALYCDPINWLENGIVDYVAPQLYWKIVGGQDYVALSKWWNDQAKKNNKQLFLSQTIEKVNNTNNWASTEIENQILQNRKVEMANSFGQIHYNFKELNLAERNKGLLTLLKSNTYKTESIVPSFFNKDKVCPNPPHNIKLIDNQLTWEKPQASVEDGDSPIKYAVYLYENKEQAISNKFDNSKIIKITTDFQLDLTPYNLNEDNFVAITSLDKNNNESGLFELPILANKEVRTRTIDVKEIKVSPNPFKDVFSLNINNIENQKLNIKLYDYNGLLVYNNNVYSDGNNINVNASNIKPGNYILEITFENNQKQRIKVIAL